MAYKKNPLKLADGTLLHINILVIIHLWLSLIVCKINKIKTDFKGNEDVVEVFLPNFGTFYANIQILSKANKEQRKQYYNELSKLNK